MLKNKYFSITLGISISLICLYMSFRKLDLLMIKQSILMANYWILIPSISILCLIFILKTLRWKILMAPLKNINGLELMKPLLIGYAANNILPAHMGEFIRAYAAGKTLNISKVSVFATIVIERIIDILSLITLMVITLYLYPFPAWVKNSGIILLIFTLLIITFIVVIKYKDKALKKILKILLKPLPQKVLDRILLIIDSFVYGIKPLKKRIDYINLFILSVANWFLYVILFNINFYTLDMNKSFTSDLIPATVIVIITTISIIIPSSPGHIGTFHWLCQISLGLFGISREVGLSYAIIMHAINYFPILFAGLFLAWREGIHLIKLSKQNIIDTDKINNIP